MLRVELDSLWELKEESKGPPTIYLGGSMQHVELETGSMAWAFGSMKYVQAAVKNVEDYLGKRGKVLPVRAKTLLSSGYHPEFDTSEELDYHEASYFQSLIGIL